MSLAIDPAAVPSMQAYVDQAAGLLGLTLAEGHRPGVIASMAVLANIARPLLDIPLSPDVESAPVYVP
jgi:hypothetical protein